MSKKTLDWAKENERLGRNVSWVARYFMVESYLRYGRKFTIWTYQSGNHPNCTDIDEYMGWKAHSTEKIVNNPTLFKLNKSKNGWTCLVLAQEFRAKKKVEVQEKPPSKEDVLAKFRGGGA